MIIAKSLIKTMSISQAHDYCDAHPPYRVPTAIEAENIDIDNIEHESFLIADELGGRVMVYNKRKQTYSVTHPKFLHNIIVIKEKHVRHHLPLRD